MSLFLYTMKINKIALLFCLTLLVGTGLLADFSTDSIAASTPVFRVNKTKSLIYSTSILGIDLLNNYVDRQIIEKPTQADIDALDKDDLLFFDQIAFQPMDQGIKDLSDYTIYFTLGASAALAYDKEYWLDNALVFTEVMLTQSAIGKWTKTLTSRYRPFVYDDDVSLSKKRQRNSQHSFYSMHSSTAFAAATYAYYYYYQKKGASWPVALLVYTPAVATAALRVACANHFVSDVTVGAVMGSAISYFICKLHTKELPVEITFTPTNLGITYRF